MQELHFGHVVQSTKGRDRFRVFIVVGIRENRSGYEAVIANGELRTLEGAKVKNPRHLKVIAELTDIEKAELNKALTNENLKKICNKYDNFSKKI